MVVLTFQALSNHAIKEVKQILVVQLTIHLQSHTRQESSRMMETIILQITQE